MKEIDFKELLAEVREGYDDLQVKAIISGNRGTVFAPVTHMTVQNGVLVATCEEGRAPVDKAVVLSVLPQVESPIPLVVWKQRGKDRVVAYVNEWHCAGGARADELLFWAHTSRRGIDGTTAAIKYVQGLCGGIPALGNVVKTYEELKYQVGGMIF